MKRIDVLNYFTAISSINKDEKFNSEFSFAVILNKKNLKNVIDSFQESIDEIKKDIPENYNIYQEEKQTLIDIYSQRDENNNIIKKTNSNGNTSVIIIDIPAFNGKMNELNDRFCDIVTKINEITKSIDEFLNKEIEIDITKIDKKDIPSTISLDFMEKILLMVN